MEVVVAMAMLRWEVMGLGIIGQLAAGSWQQNKVRSVDPGHLPGPLPSAREDGWAVRVCCKETA